MKKGCCLTVLLAWVLWAQRAGIGNGVYTTPDWRVIASFSSEQECNSNISETNNNLKQMLQSSNPNLEIIVKGNALIMSSTQRGYTIQQLLACLPDTIDPRGPKK